MAAVKQYAFRRTGNSSLSRKAAVAPPHLRSCLAEACYLLRNHPGGSQAVVHLLDRDVLKIGFDLEDEAEAVA